MEFTQNNKIGYLQALISFLVIFCSIFIIELPHEIFWMFAEISIIDIPYLIHEITLSSSEGDVGFILVLLYKVLMMALIIVHLVNIFFQSKKKSMLLGIISGVCSFVFLTHPILTLIATKEPVFENFDLMYGFFIITILAVAQILTAVLFNKNAECIHPSNIYCAPSKEPSKKELLEEELRKLQAQVRHIQKEETERKLELERAEKEKLENENMMNEIAKLKEFIRNHENK